MQRGKKNIQRWLQVRKSVEPKVSSVVHMGHEEVEKRPSVPTALRKGDTAIASLMDRADEIYRAVISDKTDHIPIHPDPHLWVFFFLNLQNNSTHFIEISWRLNDIMQAKRITQSPTRQNTPFWLATGLVIFSFFVLTQDLNSACSSTGTSSRQYPQPRAS